MNEMNITAAKYLADNGENIAIEFIVDGKIMHVSVEATGNRHYAEIMRQVDAGELTIEDAD
jgi:hypothetical protein